MNDVTEQARQLLIKNGFSGLYYPGECACTVDEFATCGMCEKEPDDNYINGCEPGYKFTDPENADFWIIRSENKAPSSEEWKQWRSEYESL